MDQEVKKEREKDILSIISLLTEDNKYHVIAVAKALLFTQKCKEKESVCQQLSECTQYMKQSL